EVDDRVVAVRVPPVAWRQVDRVVAEAAEAAPGRRHVLDPPLGSHDDDGGSRTRRRPGSAPADESGEDEAPDCRAPAPHRGSIPPAPGEPAAGSAAERAAE